MKAWIFTLFIVFVSYSLHSCGNDDAANPEPDGTVTFNVSPKEIQCDHQAQTIEIHVKSTGDWNIKSSDPEWCSLFPSGGIKNEETTVSVKLSANNGLEGRKATLTIRSGQKTEEVTVTQNATATLSVSSPAINIGGQAQTINIGITSNTAWRVSSGASWLRPLSDSGEGNATVEIAVEENKEAGSRNATLTLRYGSDQTAEVKVTQLSDEIVTPEGYRMVWNEEFNDPSITMPDESRWWYEVWDPGSVNNELQRYVAGKQGDNVTASVYNGILHINAIKTASEVISARVNTKESWTYGYFEARLKLPKGKGTWPAFWMMPQQDGPWPACGEIDIMEEVGYNPDYTSSSIHCSSYNHIKGTQKTAERLTSGAQDEFHVYALEWTPDYIRTLVDGKQLLYFPNDHNGNTDTWPFDKPFYLKLNLAWGGDWGGAHGVDESALPATYEIDYVRVFQKE